MNNPFDFFEKIYCINLDNRPEKWAICQEHFKSLGIANRVERFSGIYYETNPSLRSNDNGKYGCTHSHIELVRQAKESGIKNFLVFEDDVNPHITPLEINNTLHRCIRELPDLWDIFYLSANPLEHPDSLREYSDNLRMVRLAFTTHAIAVNHAAYDEIIRGAKTKEDVYPIVHEAVSSHINIDGYYMAAVLPRCRSYMPKKLLFTQRNGFSDCDQRLAKIDGVIIDRYNKLPLLEP